MSDEQVAWFVKRIEDPECSILHLTKWLDELRDSIPPNQRIKLLDTAIAIHRANFGDKRTNVKIDSSSALKDLKSFLEGEVVDVTPNKEDSSE